MAVVPEYTPSVRSRHEAGAEAHSSTMVRLAFPLYALLSTAVLIGTVGYAQLTRVQFYPTVIFLVTSKLCIMVSVK